MEIKVDLAYVENIRQRLKFDGLFFIDCSGIGSGIGLLGNIRK